MADVGEEKSLGDGDVCGVLVGGGVGGALVGVSQTYSPLRWSQRPGLFQPFPSLKRSLGPSELLFSIQLGNQTSRKDHHTIGVSCLVYN
jgi:hypothetical protein